MVLCNRGDTAHQKHARWVRRIDRAEALQELNSSRCVPGNSNEAKVAILRTKFVRHGLGTRFGPRLHKSRARADANLGDKGHTAHQKHARCVRDFFEQTFCKSRARADADQDIFTKKRERTANQKRAR